MSVLDWPSTGAYTTPDDVDGMQLYFANKRRQEDRGRVAWVAPYNTHPARGMRQSQTRDRQFARQFSDSSSDTSRKVVPFTSMPEYQEDERKAVTRSAFDYLNNEARASQLEKYLTTIIGLFGRAPTGIPLAPSAPTALAPAAVDGAGVPEAPPVPDFGAGAPDAPPAPPPPGASDSLPALPAKRAPQPVGVIRDEPQLQQKSTGPLRATFMEQLQEMHRTGTSTQQLRRGADRKAPAPSKTAAEWLEYVRRRFEFTGTGRRQLLDKITNKSITDPFQKAAYLQVYNERFGAAKFLPTTLEAALLRYGPYIEEKARAQQEIKDKVLFETLASEKEKLKQWIPE